MLVRTLWVHSSLQCVYNLVTRLSQDCHKVVTRLSQGCCKVVTTLLQPCHNLLTRLFLLQFQIQGFHNLVTRLSQPCDKVVTTIWYNHVTTLSQPCHFCMGCSKQLYYGELFVSKLFKTGDISIQPEICKNSRIYI